MGIPQVSEGQSGTVGRVIDAANHERYQHQGEDRDDNWRPGCCDLKHQYSDGVRDLYSFWAIVSHCIGYD